MADKIKQNGLSERLQIFEDAVLAGDNYQSLRNSISEIEEKIEFQKSMIEVFKKVGEEKLRDYENEPLFVYLAKKKYGVQGKYSIGLFSGIHAMIAKKVNYIKWRDKYNELATLAVIAQQQIAEYEKRVNAVREQIGYKSGYSSRRSSSRNRTDY